MQNVTRHIQDYESYNDRMNKSMLDKAFFLDKIESNTFVDFGCGDGSLLRFIGDYLGESKLIGYDNDSSMIEISSVKHPEIEFYHEWDKIAKIVREGKNVSLILSSVIHEIYTYCTPNQVKEIWKNIFSLPFKYIIFRDMIPSKYISRPSDINDVVRVYRKFHNTQCLTDFENVWGSIENNKNLIHFLLKYKYIEPNWQREVRENYLPIYREDFLCLLDIENYNIMYHEHFVLPYIKKTVLSDFNIDIKDPTHLKVILERKWQ